MGVPFADVTHLEHLTPGRSDSAPLALALPGGAYAVQAPLLYWPVEALEQAGYDVWSINWHAEAPHLTRDTAAAFVVKTVREQLAELPKAPEVVIAKSLGTYALPFFVEQEVRAAWLTPILTEPSIVEAARRASADHLFVGGTADKTWLPDQIQGVDIEIIEIPHANHSLINADDSWQASALVQVPMLRRVMAHLLPS